MWVTSATTAGEAGVRAGPLWGVLEPPKTFKATRATTITITRPAVPQVSSAVGERRGPGRVGAGRGPPRRAPSARAGWRGRTRWSLRRGPPWGRAAAALAFPLVPVPTGRDSCLLRFLSAWVRPDPLVSGMAGLGSSGCRKVLAAPSGQEASAGRLAPAETRRRWRRDRAAPTSAR